MGIKLTTDHHWFRNLMLIQKMALNSPASGQVVKYSADLAYDDTVINVMALNSPASGQLVKYLADLAYDDTVINVIHNCE